MSDPATAIASGSVGDSELVASFTTGRPVAEAKGATLEDCGVVVCTRHRPEAVRAFLESLATQVALPAEVLIVDASEGAATEQVVREYTSRHSVADRARYVRVAACCRGLTRQRNLALRLVSLPLVAFFDDDIVLRPECLARMAAAHRALGHTAAGVGAWIENERLTPPMLWRLRRLTGIVPTLAPGRYCRSGISTPWGFLEPTEELIPGDWLPGGATMWRTDLARTVRFEDGFAGYGSGEDLDFSLRIGRVGRLVLAGGARCLHLRAEGGRPDGYEVGYRGLLNHYHIHRRSMPGRRRRDAAWFVYAFLLDTLLRASGLVRPSRRRWTAGFVRGRMRFFVQLATGRAELHG